MQITKILALSAAKGFQLRDMVLRVCSHQPNLLGSLVTKLIKRFEDGKSCLLIRSVSVRTNKINGEMI